MEREQFQVGDVVMLKSGGPKMTVEAIGQKTGQGEVLRIQCVMLDKDGNEKRLTTRDLCFCRAPVDSVQD